MIGNFQGSDDRKKVMSTQLLMVLLKKAKMIALAWQSTYKKGPDVMIKSVNIPESLEESDKPCAIWVWQLGLKQASNRDFYGCGYLRCLRSWVR